MIPRVITRTHYQVDEPAYLGLLIRDCTSPSRSEYSEKVAQRLEAVMKARGRDFNFAAAKYCVDLARSLDLLTENNFWTWSAQTLRLVMPSSTDQLSLELSTEEKIFYLRAFLEFDGAALMFLAQKAIRSAVIPLKDEEDWNDIANEMMNSIFRAYLGIASDVRERAGIRQLLAKRERAPYAGKSGAHQCFIHLKVLARIGLLEARNREYRRPAAPPVANMLERFVALVPDVKSLEAVMATGRWPEIVQGVLGIESRNANGWTDSEILDASREMYERVIATGATLCPLNTLIEAIQIRRLASLKTPPSRDDCIKAYRAAQKQLPNKIRFQVDRMGRPAFISFSSLS